MAVSKILAMANQTTNQSTRNVTFVWYFVEIAIYAVFIFIYYWAVLHPSRGWLKELFDEHKSLYGVLALVFVLAQALLLELVTTGLFRLIRGNNSK